MTGARPVAAETQARARASLGSSGDAIYGMLARALQARGIAGGHVVDVGCGRGQLWSALRRDFSSYCGVDAVRYDTFPPDLELREVDLDAADWAVEPAIADLVVAVETIEHLENPWAFVRGLVRIAKPGGWIAVTTPNQLSLLSLLALTVKRRFEQFQDPEFPAHKTALLESDLRRLAGQSPLEDVAIEYTGRGRVPLGPWHFPAWIGRWSPRLFSDNLMMIGRKPRA